MTECPDSDALASVCGALGWSAEEVVSHIASCEECRGRMRLLDSLHAVLAEEMPVPDELGAAILDALRAEAGEASLSRARGGERWRVAALVLPLASAAAFVLLTLIVQLRVADGAPVAFDLATSVLLGLLAAGWAWRERSAGGALTRLA